MMIVRKSLIITVLCLFITMVSARLTGDHQFQNLQPRGAFLKRFHPPVRFDSDAVGEVEPKKHLHNVEFRRCRDNSPAPSSVMVECDDHIRDTCSVARGFNHTVRVAFTPKSSSRLVRSNISWRTWIEMPVPAQDREACNYMSCPLHANQETIFNYNLKMPKYVMRRRHSLIWRLVDFDSKEVLLCFAFRTHVT